MAKVSSRTSMNSLTGSSGSRTNNRVRIQEPPAPVPTQLRGPRRRQSTQTQHISQPIPLSRQAEDDSTEALEDHIACLETVRDLERDMTKLEAERDRLLEENQRLKQQLSQAQDSQSVGQTWEDIQQAVHGAQEAFNNCHQQLNNCITNVGHMGVSSATLPGSATGPDSMWANSDEGLGVLNPQVFSFDV